MRIRSVLFDADGVIQFSAPDQLDQLELLRGFVPQPIAELRPVLARWDIADSAPQLRKWLTLLHQFGITSHLRIP